MYSAADQWRYTLIFPVLGFFLACESAIATATDKQSMGYNAVIDANGEIPRKLVRVEPSKEKLVMRRKKTKTIKNLPATQTAMSLLSKFRVCGHESLIRAGPNRDGGYVVPNWPATKNMGTMFSIGINNNDPISHVLSDKFGIKAHLYDCTSGPSPCPSNLPRCNVTFHHVCAGGPGSVVHSIPFALAFKKVEQPFQSIHSMVQQQAPGLSTNLILKIDCEGCEWDSFDTLPSNTLNRFALLLGELHWLRHRPFHEKYLRVMTKLTQNFAIIHTHGCNCLGQVHFTTSNGTQFNIPDVVEMAFVRKDLLTSPLDCSMEANYQADLDVPICPFPELKDFSFKLP